MNSQITLRMVAKAAGVACSTVSKALRNDRSIPPSTRQRICKVAKKLGYQPDPVVSTLMVQLRRSRFKKYIEPIACVITHPNWKSWEGNTLKPFFEGAQERCKELGFRLENFCLEHVDWNGMRLSQILQTRGIRGILVAPLPSVEMKLDLAWDAFACAAIGYTLREPSCHRAANNHFHTVLRLLKHLDQTGYRRVGFLLDITHDLRLNHHYSAAFSVYQNYLPKRLCIPPFMMKARQLIDEDLTLWVRKYRPEVIVCTDLRIPGWLEANGWKVPEDIAVAFIVVHQYVGNSAGMDPNARKIGSAAIDLIVEQIYENTKGIPELQKVVLIDSSWRDGWTVDSARRGEPSIDWNKLF